MVLKSCLRHLPSSFHVFSQLKTFTIRTSKKLMEKQLKNVMLLTLNFGNVWVSQQSSQVSKVRYRLRQRQVPFAAFCSFRVLGEAGLTLFRKLPMTKY